LKQTVAIVGGGACALMLAAELNSEKYHVHLFEHNKTLGRKFLVAGDGGLNLTHSESPQNFIKRYTPFDFLSQAFNHFTNTDLITWLHQAGVETFTGTSKRVFPKKGIKPIEVLNVFLNKIKNKKVKIHFEHSLIDFDKKGELFFSVGNSTNTFKSDYVVFCLGGASWPVTGSTGHWLTLFKEKEIKCEKFQASNCAYKVDWKNDFIDKHHGKALKNIHVFCDNKKHEGEIVITKFGIEGSGIYPLSPEIRNALEAKKKATIFIDLKPDLSLTIIQQRLKDLGTKGVTEKIKIKLNISATAIALIKSVLSKDDFLNSDKLSQTIKKLPVQITDSAPIEDAISTVGGVDLNEINQHFELKKIENHFVIGEMLNYDAPTGGYLLQSCFSMGKFVADYLNLKP